MNVSVQPSNYGAAAGISMGGVTVRHPAQQPFRIGRTRRGGRPNLQFGSLRAEAMNVGTERAISPAESTTSTRIVPRTTEEQTAVASQVLTPEQKDLQAAIMATRFEKATSMATIAKKRNKKVMEVMDQFITQQQQEISNGPSREELKLNLKRQTRFILESYGLLSATIDPQTRTEMLLFKKQQAKLDKKLANREEAAKMIEAAAKLVSLLTPVLLFFGALRKLMPFFPQEKDEEDL